MFLFMGQSIYTEMILCKAKIVVILGVSCAFLCYIVIVDVRNVKIPHGYDSYVLFANTFDIESMTFSKMLTPDLILSVLTFENEFTPESLSSFPPHERVSYCWTGFNRNPIMQVGHRVKRDGGKKVGSDSL